VTGVFVERKGLRTDSAGPGRHRGGVGQDMVFTVDSGDSFNVNTMNDQLLCAPFGLEGGQAGGEAAYEIDGERPERPKARVRVPAGTTVLMSLPGGGGYGDPLERDPQAVAEDVTQGLVSEAAARTEYGVVVRTEDGAWVVDTSATEGERGERRDVAGV
jgi:N-methylhydantoinase B/oxoprolinase/acetone carboxylase alpha subunit